VSALKSFRLIFLLRGVQTNCKVWCDPPGHKRRLDYAFIIVLVKVPLLHWEYSFNLLGFLVPFLVILA
jgi:hypothetical protein